MVQAEPTTMTLNQFLASPLADAEPAWEYCIGGRLAQKVSPSIAHALILGWLFHRLMRYVETSGVELEVALELRTVLPASSPVPDLVVYRGHFPLGPDGEYEKYPRGAPVLAVEALSPGQTRQDLFDKLDDMVRQGVTLGLLVLPAQREVVAVSATGHAAYRGAQLIPLDAIPELRDFELRPDGIFSRLP